MDARAVGIRELSSLYRVGRVEDLVPLSHETFADQIPHHVVIFNQENGLGSAWKFLGLLGGIHGDALIDARQVHLDGSPAVLDAVDLHGSAALLDDAEDRRKAEAGALSRTF